MNQLSINDITWILEKVDRRVLIGSDVHEARRLCPYKFPSILLNNEFEHTILTWGYYLGVLVFFRDKIPHSSFTYFEHVNKAAEYFDFAERSTSIKDIRSWVRKAIPEILLGYRELRDDSVRYLTTT